MSRQGITPGDLIIGNSVLAVGLKSGISAGMQTFMGGEVEPISQMIRQGRQDAFDRMVHEAKKHDGIGITGVSIDFIQHIKYQEFLCIGSKVHCAGRPFFSTCGDGQDLYCQLDADYQPISFVFGNVAYSIGLASGIAGLLRSKQKGEVHEFSQVLYETRHMALERLVEEARANRANSVLGVKMVIRPFYEMQEMLLTGTASFNPALPPEFAENPATCSLTNDELWSLTRLGYAPIELLMGVSVYSLGVVGQLKATLKEIVGGEVDELTELIYEARSNAVKRIKKDAKASGADQVVGLRTFVYDLGGGMLEFLSIGTAVKKIGNLKTNSDDLIAQAVARETSREHPTFVNMSHASWSAAGAGTDVISSSKTDSLEDDTTFSGLAKRITDSNPLKILVYPPVLGIVFIVGFIIIIQILRGCH